MELPSCPEEGFHTEKEEENEGLMNDEEEVKIVPENVKFLRETIKHCRHFVSMVANPQWQILSMEIISEAMLRIQLEQYVLSFVAFIILLCSIKILVFQR